MATRATSPGTGWSWLVRAVNLGTKNPRAVFGAAAFIVLAAMLPTVLQLIMEYAFGTTNAPLSMGWIALSMTYSLFVVPPLVGGFLRVVHTAETGVPVRPTQLFDVFKAGGGALRIVGLMLVLFLIAMALFGVLYMVLGKAFFMQLSDFAAAAQAQAQTQSPGDASALPSLPEGFGTLIALLLVLALFFNGVYTLSMGQVALNDHGVGSAVRDGIVGTLKNLLPLLLLSVVGLVLGVVAMLLLGLAVGLLNAIGGLAHPALGMLLATPAYVVAMLALYVVMVGVMYFMWRDICEGGDAEAPKTHGHHVEL